jgi:hypothetical protein
MVVVINEFELIPAASAPPAPPAPAEGKAKEGPEPKSHAEKRAVVHTVKHAWQRHARLRAD